MAPDLPYKFQFRSVHTLDEMQQLFSDLSGVPAFSLTTGAREFLGTFGRWLQSYAALSEFMVLLPPNPSHATTFWTPLDDITASLAVANPSGSSEAEPFAVLDRYGLGADVATRPVYTLSAGERALVALAKSAILLERATKAVLCNPSRWLHPARRHSIDDTLSRFAGASDGAWFLYFEGEYCPMHAAAPASRLTYAWEGEPLEWDLVLERPTVVFPARKFPCRTSERRLTFQSSARRVTLVSPTLCVGDNGVGKTTLARMLANLLAPKRGSARIQCEGFDVAARIVDVDAARQLLAMSPVAHMNWVFSHDSPRHSDARETFERLQQRMSTLLGAMAPAPSLGNWDRPSSVLQAKLALFAERVVSGTRAVILDEPSWGLSSPMASAYLLAIVEEAHRRGVRTIVISHDRSLPQSVFSSVLVMSQRAGSEVVDITVAAERPEDHPYDDSGH